MGAIEPHSSFNALLPEQFGKYSLLGHLATGGMAEVWLARQLGIQGFEKIVVIKRARPELSDAESTELFLDEARLVATLEHPNIAQVYEIGSVNGSYFFVMEYIDGSDLLRLIDAAISKRHRISLADAIYIISHVCTALHYAHEKRDLEGRSLHIIHRDVSPSNVLISHDGAIKVCDFGIAKAHNRRSETTQRGVLKGKFSYMSPEQCQSKEIDRRSDVFSIGILLYELSTLTKLFRGDSDFALLQQIVQAPVPPPSSRMAGYPPELEAIVMKALAKSPEDRYASAQELQLDLEAFARERKLAMSSVGIARLMGTLFEKRSDVLLRAQRAQGDHYDLIEVTPRAGAVELPGFLAVGSTPLAIHSESSRGRSPGGASAPKPSETASTRAVSVVSRTRTRRRPTALWLVGAFVAGGLAAGVTVANNMIVRAENQAEVDALADATDRIAALFDASARSAHLRVDGIAATPMLRAAIGTDAATLKDLVNTEMVFTNNKNEVLEVFQFDGGKELSLLRIPSSAAALPALKGRGTLVRAEGQAAMMIASAPISGYGGSIIGGLVISSPVDMTSIRRALDGHAVRASLTGLGSELTLVEHGEPGVVATPLKFDVPSGGEWISKSVSLIASPKLGMGLTWAMQIRYMLSGLAIALLFGYLVQFARRARA